jgi:hypothetical protein
MSWDISIQNLPPDVKSVSEIANDYQPGPLGKRDEVVARIQQILPEATFTDPSWGLLNHSDFSIEFNMGNKVICDGFMLHVRGGGNAIATIGRLLQHLKLRAIDCQTGDFFSADPAQNSFNRWQAYRDRVVRREKPLDDNEQPIT